ncbi:MAG: PAS domain S-box protein [Pseudomonadota bacterium]
MRPYANIDASVTQELRYQNFLSLIYDYSGRERSLVTQVLSSPAHSDASQLINLQRGQGVLEVSWRSTFVLALQSGLYPDIQADYADAKSHYDAVHGMLEEAFYSPEAAQQGAFPLSAGLWLELSDQYLESLDTLREASRTTILNHVGRLARAADQAVVTQALLLVLTLGLCALGFWVVVVRVLRPIAGIINALVAATRGEPVNFSQSRARDDEIGKLVDVLVRFQQTLLDLRTTAANLDASERQLRAVVDNAVDGLITIDAKGLICSFNPACEHLFGYETAEVIGHNVSMLMPDPHRSSHDTFLARYNGSGEARVIGAGGRELLARRKNGTVFPIDLSVCGFKLSGEAYFSGIIRDITARKDAEAALIAHTGALERSNKELDDFAYIASHDLKEPLRGIHNHARFLLEDNGERLDEESVRRLNRLMALSQRMERLVNDLLYFSRIGRQELAIQPMDIGVVVRDIENTLEHFLEENHARIVLIEPLPLIVCDKTRVTELFRNLITNAVKYNDSEDKLIEIGVVEPRSPRSSAPVFFVRDNGRGIAPEFHDEVFRIFKRLKSVGKEAEGTGVGLTFVKKIVERHGGKIWIESSPGLGATFLFTLEANRHERTAEAA